MHPRLREIGDVLDRERHALLDRYDQIPPELRDGRPIDGEWSPAEVLEHLVLVEGGSARLLARRLERAREQGLGAEPSNASVLGSLAAERLLGGERFEAPDLVRPTGGMRAEHARSALDESRAALRAVIRDADGLALEQVTATHARLGELHMYQWLLFIAYHEARHARQLDRIVAAFAERAAR